MHDCSIESNLGGGDASIMIPVTLKGSEERINEAIAAIRLALHNEIVRQKAMEQAGQQPVRPCGGCGG